VVNLASRISYNHLLHHKQVNHGVYTVFTPSRTTAKHYSLFNALKCSTELVSASFHVVYFLVCDGVVCTAHHPGSRGMADIVSGTMPLLSIKDLAVAISTKVGSRQYKLGSKVVQAICRERVELLVEHSWR